MGGCCPEMLDFLLESDMLVEFHMGVSKNYGTPKSSILIGVFHYKPSILGYPLFLETPISPQTNSCHSTVITQRNTYNPPIAKGASIPDCLPCFVECQQEHHHSPPGEVFGTCLARWFVRIYTNARFNISASVSFKSSIVPTYC